MILRPKTWRPFAGTALGECRRMTLCDRFAAWRQQRDHLAIAGCCSLAIVWRADDEKRPVRVPGFPRGPALLRLEKFQDMAQRRHDGGIKSEGPLETGDADADM